MEKRKLRGGMVGGGIGSFFGPVHRMAATLDGQAEYVCGAFSADPQKSNGSPKGRVPRACTWVNVVIAR